MNSRALCLMLVLGLALGNATAIEPARSLLARASAQSEAKSKDGAKANAGANAFAQQGGSASAKSISSGEAFSREKDAIVRAFVDSFSKVNGGGSAFAEAKVSATTIGKAVARAYSYAGVFLSVVGKGFASGTAKSSADAIAKSTAKVIADAYAGAQNDYGFSGASINVEVVSSAVARASTRAFATGVQYGPGEVQAVQESVASAVAEPLARVIGEALAVVFQNKADSLVYVTVKAGKRRDDAQANTKSTANSDKGGSAKTKGSADASTD